MDEAVEFARDKEGAIRKVQNKWGRESKATEKQSTSQYGPLTLKLRHSMRWRGKERATNNSTGTDSGATTSTSGNPENVRNRSDSGVNPALHH